MPANTVLASTNCRYFGKTRTCHAFTRYRPARWIAAPISVLRNGASQAAHNEPVRSFTRRQLVFLAGLLTASSHLAALQLASASNFQPKRRNLPVEQLKDIIAVSNHTTAIIQCTHLHTAKMGRTPQQSAHPILPDQL